MSVWLVVASVSMNIWWPTNIHTNWGDKRHDRDKQVNWGQCGSLCIRWLQILNTILATVYLFVWLSKRCHQIFILRDAIWHYARPHKSYLALFDRSWPWYFWFGILALFLGEFGLEDFCLALMLLFGFILAFSMRRYRSTTIEVTNVRLHPSAVIVVVNPRHWALALADK